MNNNINDTISNPEDLEKHHKYPSPYTWIAITIIASILLSVFAWAFFFKIKHKVIGKANIDNNVVTLVVKKEDRDKLLVGQMVYILDKVGEIISFENGEPVLTPFSLEDGQYNYSIVVKESHPIDFLFGK